jgi:hypothetical protein
MCDLHQGFPAQARDAHQIVPTERAKHDLGGVLHNPRADFRFGACGLFLESRPGRGWRIQYGLESKRLERASVVCGQGAYVQTFALHLEFSSCHGFVSLPERCPVKMRGFSLFRKRKAAPGMTHKAFASLPEADGRSVPGSLPHPRYNWYACCAVRIGSHLRGRQITFFEQEPGSRNWYGLRPARCVSIAVQLTD